MPLRVIAGSAGGRIITASGKDIGYKPLAVERIVDTTGAGDAYCAGFLYGWVNDKPLAECARIGTVCATAVIQQVGARIERGLLD